MRQRQRKVNLIRRGTLNGSTGTPSMGSMRRRHASHGWSRRMNETPPRRCTARTLAKFSFIFPLRVAGGSRATTESERHSLSVLSWGETSHARSRSVANESRHRIRNHQLRLGLSSISPQSQFGHFPNSPESAGSSPTQEPVRIHLVGLRWSAVESVILPAAVVRTWRENWVRLGDTPGKEVVIVQRGTPYGRNEWN